jgi:hypothetical protein
MVDLFEACTLHVFNACSLWEETEEQPNDIIQPKKEKERKEAK